jgi:hypothetical protein
MVSQVSKIRSLATLVTVVGFFAVLVGFGQIVGVKAGIPGIPHLSVETATLGVVCALLGASLMWLSARLQRSADEKWADEHANLYAYRQRMLRTRGNVQS